MTDRSQWMFVFCPPCKVNRYPFLSPPSQKHYMRKDSFGPTCTWKPTCTSNQTNSSVSAWENFRSEGIFSQFRATSADCLFKLPSWRKNTGFPFYYALFYFILSPFNGKVHVVLEGRNLECQYRCDLHKAKAESNNSRIGWRRELSRAERWSTASWGQVGWLHQWPPTGGVPMGTHPSQWLPSPRVRDEQRGLCKWL